MTCAVTTTSMHVFRIASNANKLKNAEKQLIDAISKKVYHWPQMSLMPTESIQHKCLVLSFSFC